MGLKKLIEHSKKFELNKVHYASRRGEAGRQEFIQKFPLNSIKNLSLDQYSLGNGKNNFCYWLEFKKVLFGIGGGNSIKHGLYKAKKDGNYYAGQGKDKRQLSGDDLKFYFENLKKGIVTALSLAEKDQVEKIKDLEIPIWNMVLQKILSIYYPDKFIAMGSTDVLLEFAEDIELGGIELIPDNAIQINYECNKTLKSLEEFKNWDYWKLGVFVFETYKKKPDKEKDYRKEYTAWLSKKDKDKTGTASSYIKAIDILSGIIKKEIFTISDVVFLESFYKDLINEQGDPNGKYFHEKAPSYGKNGFYSASVKSYINFLNNKPTDVDQVSFADVLEKYSPNDLTIYLSFLFEALDRFQIKKGNTKLLYSTTNNNLAFTIGQRMSWLLHKSNKRGKFGVLSIDKIRSHSEEFSGNSPYPFFTYFNSIEFSKEDKESIFRGFEQELKRTTKSGFSKYTNKDFENAVFDKSFRAQFIKTATMKENNNTVLNKILYGPPGTGKTYNTVNEALKIADPKFYNENEGNRELLNKRFKELLIKNWDNTNGQIAFCTFHQSFSYEDFVEGIKPQTNEKKEIYYEIEDGIFKKICQLADSSISAVKMKKEGKLSWDEEKFKNASFYKLSLGDSKKTEDKEIYEYCRDNNYIAIGFGKDHDFTGLSETEIKEFCENRDELTDTDAQQLNYFIHNLKVGNYVLISNGNKFVRALGRVIGEYEFDANSPIRYNQFRKVEWIFKDENIPIEELYNRGFSQQTLYKIDEDGLKKDFFVNHGQNAQSETKKVKDYVIIIDEINRGNVSSIFGELITLIEPDKRAGKKEELEVTLPYSKEPFKVPHNVYIVGTMNTADRSIEALDTALRRRFSFKEMPPKPELIEAEGNSGKINGIADGINLKSLLQTINNRIEKLIDKDHKIGHSYFLKVNNKESLIHCFENEVIPLLEEYFFGDYGKIGLVLGNSFVVKDETDAFEFAEFEGYDSDVSSDLKERSVYKIRPSKEWDFNSI